MLLACAACHRQYDVGDHSECETKRLRYVECWSCGGLWPDEPIFERVVEKRDALLAEMLPFSTREGPGRSIEDKVVCLACPVCSNLMNRRNFADSSGVLLDGCRGHGWWFDAQGLERVFAFVDAGGLERARERKHELRRLSLERMERKARDATRGLERLEQRRKREDFTDALIELAELLGRVF